MSTDRKIHVGDEFYWNDPDEGIGSQYVIVLEILKDDMEPLEDDTIIIVKGFSTNDFEVFAHELE